MSSKLFQCFRGLCTPSLTSFFPTGLRFLDVSFNQISTIPPELARLTSLTRLNLSFNPLGDFFPIAITGMVALKELNLDFTGEHPSSHLPSSHFNIHHRKFCEHHCHGPILFCFWWLCRDSTECHRALEEKPKPISNSFMCPCGSNQPDTRLMFPRSERGAPGVWQVGEFAISAVGGAFNVKAMQSWKTTIDLLFCRVIRW